MGAIEAFYFNITQYPGGEDGVLHNKFIVTDSAGACLCVDTSMYVDLLKVRVHHSGLLLGAARVRRGHQSFRTIGVIILSLFSKAGCVRMRNRAGAAASMKRRRREPAMAISPD